MHAEYDQIIHLISSCTFLYSVDFGYFFNYILVKNFEKMMSGNGEVI